MKKLLFIIAVSLSLAANAQNYLLTFTGTGESNSVSTVKVENLMKGTTRTLSGNDILRLTSATGVNSIKDNKSNALKIYPNPMTDNSTLEICPPVAGNAVITVYEMTGKPIAQIQSDLENSRQDFRISGIKNSMYIINVKGSNYQFSGILLNNSKSGGTIRIEKVNSIIQAADEKEVIKDSKGTLAIIDMSYSTGDRLKFTGISSIYSTVITDIPQSDKTITFNFIACTDGDNNNYPVVAIGTQFWMAENLKTTKYNNNLSIPLVTDNTAWASLTTPGYCWYNNNEAEYKDVNGAIYNWYAVDVTVNGGKNICPVGWHVPNDVQWTTLTDYLTANGYGFNGSGNDVAKSIAASTGWISSLTEGTPGNDKSGNNSSGFTATPNDLRDGSGSFGSLGSYGFWWSSTESITGFAWGRQMYSDISTFDKNNIFKYYGSAVRCLKD